MEIQTELLVADLAKKVKEGLISYESPNLEADIRSAVMLAQSDRKSTRLNSSH